MRSFGRIGFLVLAIVQLAACATPASREVNFTPSSAAALLVFAGPPAMAGTFTEFRRVDLERGLFEEGSFEVINAGLAGHQVNQSTRSGIWLSFREVPAGNYAVISVTTSTSGYNSVGESWIRTDERAPVFSLAPGTITVVRADGAWTIYPLNANEDAILNEFSAVRSNFPGIVGEPAVARPVAIVSWERRMRGCIVPEGFSRLQ